VGSADSASQCFFPDIPSLALAGLGRQLDLDYLIAMSVDSDHPKTTGTTAHLIGLKPHLGWLIAARLEVVPFLVSFAAFRKRLLTTGIVYFRFATPFQQLRTPDNS
jgi:hypothetical protein